MLAGSRGPDDPVARAAGVAQKAFVPVAGRPMLARVLDTLLACERIGQIAVSMNPAAFAEADSETAALVRRHAIAVMPTAASPALSVAEALARGPVPLLVTTGDHPLLTAAMVAHFLAAVPENADVAVALAPGSIVQAAHPEAVRTYFRFAGERYSGCNLFLFRTPGSAAAAAFWVRMERHRKRPLRLSWEIGPWPLLRFLLGRLTLDGALVLLSRRTGVRIAAVSMPFAEAAIDVDKPADLALAESLLRRSP